MTENDFRIIFTVANYDFFKLINSSPTAVTHMIRVEKIQQHPTYRIVNHTVSGTQNLEPSFSLKTKSEFLLTSTEILSDSEILYLIKVSVSKSLVKLDELLVRSCQMKLGVPVPEDEELMQYLLMSGTPLN